VDAAGTTLSASSPISAARGARYRIPARYGRAAVVPRPGFP
jgi:hypothetical protein